jgi:hypothetical protein
MQFKKEGMRKYMNSVQVTNILQVKKNVKQGSGENLLLSVAFFLKEDVPFYPSFLNCINPFFVMRHAWVTSEIQSDCKK